MVNLYRPITVHETFFYDLKIQSIVLIVSPWKIVNMSVLVDDLRIRMIVQV